MSDGDPFVMAGLIILAMVFALALLGAAPGDDS